MDARTIAAGSNDRGYRPDAVVDGLALMLMRWNRIDQDPPRDGRCILAQQWKLCGQPQLGIEPRPRFLRWDGEVWTDWSDPRLRYGDSAIAQWIEQQPTNGDDIGQHEPRHDYLGGLAPITVPHFGGVYGWLAQRMGRENYEQHNVSIMSERGMLKSPTGSRAGKIVCLWPPLAMAVALGQIPSTFIDAGLLRPECRCALATA